MIGGGFVRNIIGLVSKRWRRRVKNWLDISRNSYNSRNIVQMTNLKDIKSCKIINKNVVIGLEGGVDKLRVS
jgi:hypothetical protein